MAKLRPLLQEKWDALGNDAHRELFNLAATMSVPFWWHGPTPVNGAIYNNGTVCLVDTGARVLGVTAWHVYDKYLAHLHKDVLFICQFGGVTVFPERLLIDEDEKLDLATFDLTEVIDHLEAYVAHRPEAWPPRRPVVSDLVIYGGFPGTRRRADLERATFGLDTVTGLVSAVTRQNLVVEVDYARLSDADGPQGNVVSADPCGTSGGPVYRITASAQGPGLEMIGFIYEHSELNRFVLARHADFIRPDGTIVM